MIIDDVSIWTYHQFLIEYNSSIVNKM
jgi:hypothetical protein